MNRDSGNSGTAFAKVSQSKASGLADIFAVDDATGWSVN